MRLDGYIRVSKVAGRAGESFISPNVQRDQIAGWARTRGATIAEWHVDLDQTGGKLERPGLDAAMERVRTRQTEGIAVARLDRLSRASVLDALRLVQEIHDHGASLAALDLGLDPTTPFGEFGMTVLLALGRMQRRNIADGWGEATANAIRRGVHGHAPFGFRKDAPGARLEPDPGTAPLVLETFERRAHGESWAAIARWLDTQGAPPARGKHWTRRSVENVIHNRAYLGEARYGKHVNAGAHQPLVPIALFAAANEAHGIRPARGEPALLSGLARCAGCRHRLHAATVGQRKQLVYRCRRNHGEGRCPAPAYVQRDLLDALVEHAFLAHYQPVVEPRAADTSLISAQNALEAAEQELAAYRDNTTIRRVLTELGPGHFEAGLTERAQRVKDARAGLDRARRESGTLDLGDALTDWASLTVTERRRLVIAGVDAVFLRRTSTPGAHTLDPGRVLVMWRGQAPEDLPGPGLRVDLRGIDW